MNFVHIGERGQGEREQGREGAGAQYKDIACEIGRNKEHCACTNLKALPVMTWRGARVQRSMAAEYKDLRLKAVPDR